MSEGLVWAESKDSQKAAKLVSWVADRLVNVYGESPNVDFVLALRALAEELREK
jgi:hypothetical protein